MTMDVWRYAEVKAGEGLRAARTAWSQQMSQFASRGTAVSGFAPTRSLESALASLRESTRDALDGLRQRTMTEEELAEWESAWSQCIRRQHSDFLEEHSDLRGGDDLLQRARESEQECLQELTAFVAAGRDKLRAETRARAFQWRLVVVGAVVGAILGIAGTLLIQVLTRG